MTKLGTTTPVRLPSGVTVHLTVREFQVLLGMSQGCSNQEISNIMYVDLSTVKTHARRLFTKLGVSDRAHAVATGFRAGVLR